MKICYLLVVDVDRDLAFDAFAVLAGGTCFSLWTRQCGHRDRKWVRHIGRVGGSSRDGDTTVCGCAAVIGWTSGTVGRMASGGSLPCESGEVATWCGRRAGQVRPE
jgi:hypothetical protein